jgi:hypothetical protein
MTIIKRIRKTLSQKINHDAACLIPVTWKVYMGDDGVRQI